MVNSKIQKIRFQIFAITFSIFLFRPHFSYFKVNCSNHVIKYKNNWTEYCKLIRSCLLHNFLYPTFLQRKSFSFRSFQTSAVCQHDTMFVHRDTPEDNPDTPFEFTEENKKVHNLKVPWLMFYYLIFLYSNREQKLF